MKRAFLHFTTLALLTVMPMVLAGCAGGDKGQTKEPVEQFAKLRAELLDDAAMNTLIASHRNSRKNPSISLGIYKDLIPGEFSLGETPVDRFDLLVKDVEAKPFFQNLVKDDRSVSMVIHPLVAGKISLELKDVTIDEVVEVACEMYHFECSSFGGGLDDWRGYKIMPWQLVTRTYRVDFLPISRDGFSVTKINDGEFENSTASTSEIRTRYDADFWTSLEATLRSILNLDLITTSVKDTLGKKGLEKREVEKKPFDSQYDTVVSVEKDQIEERESEKKITKHSSGRSYSKHIAKGVEVDFNRELDSQDGKSGEKIGSRRVRKQLKNLMVNRQSGLITVRAYPKDHTDIKEFLSHLRSRSQRQVVLEAKILEVVLSDGSQLGVDWLAINRGLGGNSSPPLSSEPSSGTTFTHSITTPLLDSSNDSLLTSTTTYGKGLIFSKGGAGTPFGLAIRSKDFVGFVSLLKKQGKVQVLSSPRIATLNNQKAVIKVGQDEVFITGMKQGNSGSSTNGDGNTVVMPIPVFEKMFTGVSMDVTPQISDDGYITLHVHPLITEVSDKTKTFNINDQVQSIPLALSQTRETDSIIRIQNGQVAVIGGLMKKSSTETEDKIPVLGDIPGIGGMFKQVIKAKVTSELVILIRPIIVGANQQWSADMVKMAQRLQDMENRSSDKSNSSYR
ncbi:MAG: pilus (MSHA type) biogenesis protein MshL [Magnetococcales bacterium]|nr:pilus (MSHA type) biogenesis protein MshL [Magnetococcales bacterium]